MPPAYTASQQAAAARRIQGIPPQALRSDTSFGFRGQSEGLYFALADENPDSDAFEGQPTEHDNTELNGEDFTTESQAAGPCRINQNPPKPVEESPKPQAYPLLEAIALQEYETWDDLSAALNTVARDYGFAVVKQRSSSKVNGNRTYTVVHLVCQRGQKRRGLNGRTIYRTHSKIHRTPDDAALLEIPIALGGLLLLAFSSTNVNGASGSQTCSTITHRNDLADHLAVNRRRQMG